MRQRIVGIGKLIENDAAALISHFFRDVARHLHAALLRRQHELRPERGHRLAALDRQMFGHDEDHLVAHHRRAHGERDAGVAAGGLDQRIARFDVAPLLRAADHRERRPILHRSGGVVAFELGEDDVARASRQALQPDERRRADEIFQRSCLELAPRHHSEESAGLRRSAGDSACPRAAVSSWAQYAATPCSTLRKGAA
jgi:hypothetical protein